MTHLMMLERYATVSFESRWSMWDCIYIPKAYHDVNAQGATTIACTILLLVHNSDLSDISASECYLRLEFLFIKAQMNYWED